MAPIKKHHDGGVDALITEINQLNQDSPIYILFCGSKNEKGESWCPDCVKAAPVVDEAIKKLKDEAIFIHCDVGQRDQWKTPTNPFRLHEDIRLTAVPTLLKWKADKRLVEGECLNSELLEMIFEGDTT